MDCSSVVLGLKLPCCVCLTHYGSRKIRVLGRYTSIRVSGSCIWLLHIGEDQTVCYGLHGYDNVDTSVVLRYRVYVLDVSKGQRGRSVSFVILCMFVWMEVIVDDDARVVEMLYH